ncbi:Spore development regulator vosA [Lasiodiplodia theobromae]|nr:Spore development regulator vosA [Lasiodiplodia theobromae]KAF4542148.1 Spore development regulator vosA [Lasiodiplodia theobromae]
MMPTHFGPPSGSYMPMYMGGPVYAQQPQHQHQTDVRPLSSADVELVIRQQPKEALVTVDGKEKARKPVDPPPIIQLRVKPNADPQGHYMQSPYLIMIADLWHPEEDEANPDKALSGTICSSLHRLKDVDNKDGAFFVFGDISIKQQGEHRLRFSLFDIHKPGNVYEFVTSIISDRFKVVSAKDFHGMDESTYLSRAFSDQGVRLRLRKEPRHVMG